MEACLSILLSPASLTLWEPSLGSISSVTSLCCNPTAGFVSGEQHLRSPVRYQMPSQKPSQISVVLLNGHKHLSSKELPRVDNTLSTQRENTAENHRTLAAGAALQVTQMNLGTDMRVLLMPGLLSLRALEPASPAQSSAH